MPQEQAYQILGLERGASTEEVRSAHRTLMKRAHPDQGECRVGGACQRGPGSIAEPTSLNSTRVARLRP
ncbi:J domain-containing protein [Methylobacterium persicinum]